MTEQYQRPTWDDYFIEVAHAISKRATCDRGRSGCVIAKDHQLLVTGYVGSPAVRQQEKVFAPLLSRTRF